MQNLKLSFDKQYYPAKERSQTFYNENKAEICNNSPRVVITSCLGSFLMLFAIVNFVVIFLWNYLPSILTADLGILSVNVFRLQIFTTVLTITVLTFVVGCMQCSCFIFATFKPYRYMFLFGVLLFAVWLAFIIVGTVVVTVGVTGLEKVDAMCENPG